MFETVAPEPAPRGWETSDTFTPLRTDPPVFWFAQSKTFEYYHTIPDGDDGVNPD